MSMTKVLGAALQTGVTSSGIQGVHEQSATKSAAGELKTYKDKDGKTISVYAVDRHLEYSFEALLASSVQDKKIDEAAATPVVRAFALVAAARQRNGGKHKGFDYVERAYAETLTSARRLVLSAKAGGKATH